MKLLLATRNAGKVEEIKSILAGFKLEILSIGDIRPLPEVIEDGATLEENALKKARETFTATGIPVISDDTGLEVYRLGMKPGVVSARYAGEHVSYRDNYEKLLREMSHLTNNERGAQFRCIAVYVAEGIERSAEGICRGVITLSPRGTGGFGYDPVFVPEGFEQTFAELEPEIKNRISHRALAMLQLARWLGWQSI